MGKASREKQAVRSLQEQLAPIYESLPKIACTGACHDCCGPISWGTREAKLVTRVTGKPATFVTHGDSIRCNYLDESKRCEVYALRPLICRIYGLVPAMKCPFGCVPERWLTDEEARELLRRIRPIVGDWLPPKGDVTAEQWVREYFERVAQAEQARKTLDTLQGPADILGSHSS